MKSLIFTSAMVPALLAGRKTRTSRIIKPQPRDGTSDFHFCTITEGFAKNMLNRPGLFFKAPQNEWIDTDMPFHEFIPAPLAVGDIFYAKETWQPDDVSDKIWYLADFTESDARRAFTEVGDKWKSPLFMPEWASRYKGEITAVKAQRIQDITIEEAVAEGVPGCRPDLPNSHAIAYFRALRDSLHGAGAWDLNSYVWAYDFRRIEEEK